MTEPSMMSEQRRLPTLTALRWYAALLVFVFHFQQNAKLHVLEKVAWGYTGVAFFFVLSGFVLAWSAGPRVSPGRFWWRRFARVYPTHLVAFVLTAIITSFVTFHYLVRGTGRAVAQILLIQAWWPHGSEIGYNGPAWSLSAEAFFYLCFPLALVLFRRSRLLADVIVVVALAAGLIFAYQMSQRGLLDAATAQFFPLARLPEFLLGIWLALRVGEHPRLRMPIWIGLVAVAGCAFLTWRYLSPYYPAPNYMMIVGYSVLIVAGACADRRGSGEWLRRLLRTRTSIYLGEVSFAFYLTHWLTVNALKGPLGIKDGVSHVRAIEGFLLMLAVSFAAAVVLHHLVERPAQRWLTAGRQRPDVKHEAAHSRVTAR